MTKRNHKNLIRIENNGVFKKAYYVDIYCGTYTKSFKDSEIKELVYNDLKENNLLY